MIEYGTAASLIGSGAIGAGVSQAVRSWAQRKQTAAATSKTSADADLSAAGAASTLTAAALQLVTELHNEVGALRLRLNDLVTEVGGLKAEVVACEAARDVDRAEIRRLAVVLREHEEG